ncbi:MAG: hypothetical protein WCI17_06365 [bacterium]
MSAANGPRPSSSNTGCLENEDDDEDEPERWHPFDFNGRLPALVQNPASFQVRPDGVIVQHGTSLMGPDAHVFDTPGAGQVLDLDHDPELFDLAAAEENGRKSLPAPKQVRAQADYCARARAATERAIMFTGLGPWFGFHGGMARFSMLCLTQPEHSCGAIYDLLDGVLAAGFDALNPVQWSAGSATYRQWKDKARGRLTLWGGGVNTQTTLPFGRVADIEREVRQVVPCLAAASGYVFCAIHNLLAEIPPEKVIALYRTAKNVGN